MKKFILTVGLNDKDVLKQIIPTKKAYGILTNIIRIYANGCTFTEKTGFYKHENGSLTFETSIQIEIVFIGKLYVNEMTDIMKIVYMIKKEFNQETILFETVNTNSKLI